MSRQVLLLLELRRKVAENSVANQEQARTLNVHLVCKTFYQLVNHFRSASNHVTNKQTRPITRLSRRHCTLKEFCVKVTLCIISAFGLVKHANRSRQRSFEFPNRVEVKFVKSLQVTNRRAGLAAGPMTSAPSCSLQPAVAHHASIV